MHVHRSNRLEALVDALAAIVELDPPAPTDPEIIVVPSRAVDRWLSAQLASRFGIWTGPRAPFPRRFLDELFADRARPQHGLPSETHEFSPSRLTWAIAQTLPSLLDHQEFAPVRRYLGGDIVRRLELAHHLATVFDSYPVFRPELPLAWEKGESGWQPALWRAVVALLGPVHLYRRAQSFLKALDRGKLRPGHGLPNRISVFVPTTLPPLFVDVLAALGRVLPVHLFLLSPSPHYWAEIRRSKGQLQALRGTALGDGLAEQMSVDSDHALLASLAKTGADFQFVLEGRVNYVEQELYEVPQAQTLLEVVQSDLFTLSHRHLGNPEALPLTMADRTIVVHACHGPTREVEVLRDELLGLFNDDPTLLPRHVLVLTPDLETYAPVIDAVFGAAPTGWVPYGFVGRGLVAESPVVEAFLTLVDIAQGRLAASGVLDLLSRDPVRRHFAISEEDLPTLRGWLSAVNIRWGVDAAHRATFDQPQTFETTWRFGFDRMLLGYAMPGADPAGTGRGAPLFAGTLPFDEIEGGHAALLGRFGLFCQRLFDLAANLLTPRTVHDWCAFLTTTIGLFLAASDDDATSLQQLRDTLSSLAADASRFDESIPLAALTPRLGELLAVPGGADDVMSGGITFGPLTTLCRIPARVVVLLGANDGVFPRSSRASTFDLVARNPRRGDPSPRDEDRYAFLEAILSARERLIITYVGQSIRDNATLPPSVVVADLLDLIDRSFVGGRALVWGRQPLQGFSPANFVGPRPSFDAVSFQAAHALVARGAGEKPAGMFSSRLAPVPLGPRLDLEDLIAFFAHPVKALLRGRLGLRLGEEVRDLDNREPMDLTPLDNFTLGTDLLARALAGEDLRKALPSVRASGTLPLGTVGTCRFEDEVEEVLALAAKVRRYTTGERLPPLEVNLEVGGTHLTGWLRNCWSQWQVAPRYGRCAPAFELAVWIRHLAMQTVTGAPRRTVIVARDTKQKPVVRVYAAVEDAPVLLADLVALYDLGQHLPLCFFPDTSRAYAMAELKGDFGLRSARQAWQGWVGMQGEGANPYNARVFRGQDPYEPGYCLVDPEEPSFAELALRIWKPVWRATDGA